MQTRLRFAKPVLTGLRRRFASLIGGLINLDISRNTKLGRNVYNKTTHNSGNEKIVVEMRNTMYVTVNALPNKEKQIALFVKEF